jgi:hypothetical protein
MLLVLSEAFPEAQQLLDRVVARVDGYAITLTDVRAAVALGVVDVPPGASEREATERVIERQLMLAEVARFAPADPRPETIADEVQAIEARTGGRVSAIAAETGLDDGRVREIAREQLRIAAYLDQRFGTVALLTEEEVLQYYRIHPDEFTRDGRIMPFAEAEPIARQRAGAERRAAAVAQWIRDLRARAEIVLTK